MRKGFTIIELITTLAIIGTLVAISVFGISQANARSRDNSRKADLRRLQGVLQQYYLERRSYPDFDTKEADSKNRTYSAVWQLTDDPACSHDTVSLRRLSPSYINTIPEDPRAKVNLATAKCDQFSSPEDNQYLYISGPTNLDGPQTAPNAFALLASLETKADSVTDTPLRNTWTDFGSWYGTNNYSQPDPGVTANYVLTGKNGH